MAKIAGEIVISRPAEAVFDFAADQRNEPRYNPRMIRADKVSDGPVGKGRCSVPPRSPWAGPPRCAAS